MGKITISDIKQELAKVNKWKANALSRMKRQEKTGDHEGAALSRKAYEYCSDYAKRLGHIIDGYKNQRSGKVFTKDGCDRYRDKVRRPEE